ncbi:hypothetical protein ACSBR1_005327 [Camellia fascicularis]
MEENYATYVNTLLNMEELYLKGIIHRIEADDVLLKFSKNFHMNYQVGVLYNIRFS